MHESPLHHWGFASTARVWIGGNHLDARKEIEAIAASLRAPPEAPLDGALIAPVGVGEAVYFASKLTPRLARGGSVWIAWPSTDLEGITAVGEQLGEAGFDEFQRVALSEAFVTVGFRRRGESSAA